MLQIEYGKKPKVPKKIRSMMLICTKT